MTSQRAKDLNDKLKKRDAQNEKIAELKDEPVATAAHTTANQARGVYEADGDYTEVACPHCGDIAVYSGNQIGYKAKCTSCEEEISIIPSEEPTQPVTVIL